MRKFKQAKSHIKYTSQDTVGFIFKASRRFWIVHETVANDSVRYIHMFAPQIIYILEQISNATVFNLKYFRSDISYQAYFSYVSFWGYMYEVSFR